MTNKFKKRTILLTGGTGVFGRFLLRELAKQSDLKIILLIRATSKKEAENRVVDFYNPQSGNIEIYAADLSLPFLGLSETDFENIRGDVTHVLHAAASIRFNNQIEQARLSNVVTTKNVLEFSKKCVNLHRFGFVSTALVAGNRSGIILEDEFEHSSGFKNTYEQSKYEAEALVRFYSEEIPTVIFRPPLIITSNASQKTAHNRPINLLTLSATLMGKGYLPFIPGSENSTMDIVNSDDAARVIVSIFLKDDLHHMTYHITNGDKAVRIKEIHSIIENYLGKKISLEFCGSMPSFLDRVRKIPWYRPALKYAYRKASSFLPEAAYPKIFDNRNTLSELGLTKLGEDPRDTLNVVFRRKSWNLSE